MLEEKGDCPIHNIALRDEKSATPVSYLYTCLTIVTSCTSENTLSRWVQVLVPSAMSWTIYLLLDKQSTLPYFATLDLFRFTFATDVFLLLDKPLVGYALKLDVEPIIACCGAVSKTLVRSRTVSPLFRLPSCDSETITMWVFSMSISTSTSKGCDRHCSSPKPVDHPDQRRLVSASDIYNPPCIALNVAHATRLSWLTHPRLSSWGEQLLNVLDCYRLLPTKDDVWLICLYIGQHQESCREVVQTEMR